MINILVLGRKSSAKPKSAKKGDDPSKACSNVVPFESGLPPVGNIVLEGSPPPSAYTRSSVRPTASKSKFTASRLSTNAPPSSRTRGSKRKTFAFFIIIFLLLSTESMLSLTLLFFFFFNFFYRAFVWLTLIHLLTRLFIFVFCFLFFCSLSIRWIYLPPVPYYLMSQSLRYVSFLSSFFFFSLAHISSVICRWLSHLPFNIIASYGFLCS